PVDSPDVRFTVGLAPDGSPVTLAARGGAAVAVLGIVPAAVVVDLANRRVARTVALPANSGATGVAFVNDSVIVAGNPNLNSVTPVNVRTGARGADVRVGGYPQRVLFGGTTVAVLNAELGPDFSPARAGTVTVLDAATLAVRGTINLTGFNPGDGAFGPDGRLYVLNSGSFGKANGSLSVVDVELLREVEHHTGFGEFPAAAAFGPDGLLYLASFGYGIAIWSPGTRSFVRTPQNALKPGNIPSSSGLGFDSRGRLHALKPECAGASSVFRLSAAFTVETETPVGTCPIDVTFTFVP
ncbi:MAG: hypothetical protein HY701_09685, partial [Gemmatimonadetes bacterium]|nr:hypothetical protein [Gemmatimonadota bacterium]